MAPSDTTFPDGNERGLLVAALVPCAGGCCGGVDDVCGPGLRSPPISLAAVQAGQQPRGVSTAGQTPRSPTVGLVLEDRLRCRSCDDAA